MPALACQPPVPPVVNLAAYKFAPLENLPALREQLLGLSRAAGLRGTILLSPEGINLFIAGPRETVDALLVVLRDVPGLADLTPKESRSEEQPFNRMLVKIKREIIAFGEPGIEPARQTATRLPARTLKQWLDQGRAVTLLDTRNGYEVRLGTFDGARAIGIEHFREFPAAARRLPEELKAQPVVTFCTGGIRCEKAAPVLIGQGFKNVFQLDGGILQYFEECGDAHFKGRCFVFDQRVALDGNLEPEVANSQ